jgi:hypothetical protein
VNGRALVLTVALLACDGRGSDTRDGATDDAAPGLDPVRPGVAVGPIALGATWAELRATLGEPADTPVVLVRLGHARWPDLGLEALLVSRDDSTLSDDAVVIGAATTSERRTRDEIEATFGEAPEQYAGYDFHPTGLGVAYGDDDRSDLVAVFAPYTLAAEPPEMMPASTDRRRPPALPSGTPIVDMHLHPGDYGTMALSGKSFIAANLPPFLRTYAPALLDALSDPYAPHVGIQAQTALAGVHHAVLFAVYTQETTGYFTNEALEAVLDDPRNVTADGLPWAWGMVRVDFEGWTPEVAESRLAAMRSYLVQRPDLFIGIKLAHAHRGVPLDDPAYLGVYQVARDTGVPVLLHTGFSPFPGAETDPAYYDPSRLAAVVAELPDVDFVLSHVGQGDARAIEHALELAEANDNVWLELSALGRPLLIDENGAPAPGVEPQYPAVLAAIRARGLIGRALFASDGPQSSGSVRTYLGRIRQGMIDAGYQEHEIADVMGGNFVRLFLEPR